MKSIQLEKREELTSNYDPVREKGIQIFCLINIIGTIAGLIYFLYPFQTIVHWFIFFGILSIVILLVMILLYVWKEK